MQTSQFVFHKCVGKLVSALKQAYQYVAFIFLIFIFLRSLKLPFNFFALPWRVQCETYVSRERFIKSLLIGPTKAWKMQATLFELNCKIFQFVLSETKYVTTARILYCSFFFTGHYQHNSFSVIPFLILIRQQPYIISNQAYVTLLLLPLLLSTSGTIVSHSFINMERTTLKENLKII